MYRIHKGIDHLYCWDLGDFIHEIYIKMHENQCVLQHIMKTSRDAKFSESRAIMEETPM